MSLSLLSVILAVLALMVLIYLDFEPIYSAIIACFIVIIFNGVSASDIITTLTTTIVEYGASSLANMIFMCLAGAALAEVYNKTGAAVSLANFISRAINKLIKGDSIRARLHSMLLTIEIIGIFLMLGGLNGFVCMFALYPIVLSLLKANNLPRRYVVGLTLGLATAWAQMVPGSPQLYNAVSRVLIMAAGGTDATSTSAMIPGLVGAAFIAVCSYLYFYFALRKEYRKGNGYIPGPGDPNEKAGQENPVNPWLTMIPLVLIFCLYNFLDLDLGATCTCGFLLAIILFHKKFKNFRDAVQTVSSGMKNGSYPLIIALFLTGFGSIMAETEGYQTILNAMVNLNSAVPLAAIAIAIMVLVGVMGNAMTGLQVCLPGITALFTSLGVSGQAIHRVAATAATTFDSLPTNTAMITLNKLCGTRQRDTYGPVFVSTVLITFIATWIVVFLCTVMGV